MNIKLGDRWNALLKDAVDSGRFASPEDVVNEGLRLLEERERRVTELRQSISDAVKEPGRLTEADLDAAVAKKVEELRARGVGA